MNHPCQEFSREACLFLVQILSASISADSMQPISDPQNQENYPGVTLNSLSSYLRLPMLGLQEWTTIYIYSFTFLYWFGITTFSLVSGYLSYYLLTGLFLAVRVYIVFGKSIFYLSFISCVFLSVPICIVCTIRNIFHGWLPLYSSPDDMVPIWVSLP